MEQGGGGGTPRFWTPPTPQTNCWPLGGLGGEILGGPGGGGRRGGCWGVRFTKGGGGQAPPNSWVCGPGVIRQFAPPLPTIEGRVSSAWVFPATLGTSRGWAPEAVMGLELHHATRHIYIWGLECKCKSVVIAIRGGGLRPHRHDCTSPLPAYTTLAPTFAPNVSKNEKEGPKTKTDSLEHFLRINLRREGPKTKSGSSEHFLRIDLRGEVRGRPPAKKGTGKSPCLNNSPSLDELSE